MASYSLRSFDRAKAIEMLKALKINFVSIKDVHLSQTIPAAEIEAGAKEFTSAGIKIMSGGNISLNEPTVDGMRKHFEYAKHAGDDDHRVRPDAGQREGGGDARQGIQHQVRDSQSRPRG